MIISNPIFISLVVAFAVGLTMYFLFVPKNNGQIIDTENSSGLSKIIGTITNDVYQSLPSGYGAVKSTSKTESLLQRSGNPWKISAHEFVYLKVVLFFAGILLGLLVYLGTKGFITYVPWWAWVIGFGIFGYFTPYISYSSEAKDREEYFVKELPTALDLLIVSVRAGSPLDAAIRDCTPLMREGVVKSGFQRISVALASGKSLNQALDEFEKEVPNDGIKTFILALKESIEKRTPVEPILKTRSEASRQEYFALIKQQAAQLSTKMLISLMATMIPALMILLLAPAVLKFGQIM